MGKIEKGVTCSVVGCDKPATHTLSRGKLKGINLGDIKFKEENRHRLYLCSEHYKLIKKKLKKIKKLDKMRYSLFR
ncbi:MAG: hypothetical protein ACP6IS_04870 [Candidatus Asgardarchaeia archaeon]